MARSESYANPIKSAIRIDSRHGEKLAKENFDPCCLCVNSTNECTYTDCRHAAPLALNAGVKTAELMYVPPSPRLVTNLKFSN